MLYSVYAAVKLRESVMQNKSPSTRFANYQIDNNKDLDYPKSKTNKHISIHIMLYDSYYYLHFIKGIH